MKALKVGLLFGGRSDEHEVSLASAASVGTALQQAGHSVVGIGVRRDGGWVTGSDSLRVLCRAAAERLREGDAVIEAKRALVDYAVRTDLLGGPPGRSLPATTLPPELGEVDVVFIIMLGPNGEDGTIQGLCEFTGIPYTGSGVLASAVSMDKAATKALLTAHGLPVVDHVVATRLDMARSEYALRRIGADIGFPCFVKPANLGSSVGVSRVTTLDDLRAGLDEAFAHDEKVLIERAVSAREIEVSVLGNEVPMVSRPGEIVHQSAWYDYETKYTPNAAKVVAPADIPMGASDRIRDLARRAYQVVGCSGMARIDFFLEGDRLYVNELNTVPGFTPSSAYALLWGASGVSYLELVNRLLELGLDRFQAKRRQEIPSALADEQVTADNDVLVVR